MILIKDKFYGRRPQLGFVFVVSIFVLKAEAIVLLIWSSCSAVVVALCSIHSIRWFRTVSLLGVEKISGVICWKYSGLSGVCAAGPSSRAVPTTWSVLVLTAVRHSLKAYQRLAPEQKIQNTSGCF